MVLPSDTDSYSGGELFTGGVPVPPLGDWNDQMGDDDFAFKTYVSPAPPPDTIGSPTTPTVVKKKKCKKHKKKHSASSAKKKKCKKKKKKH